MSQELANKLTQEFENKEITEVLYAISERYKNTSIFTTSFGIEDQVITHFIFDNTISIKVATLDTGRLFKETYKTYSKTLEQYKKPIHCYFPQNTAVEKMMTDKGPSSFYESVENRKECCYIRKIEPLKRLLAGNALWITGIRADQSENRTSMQLFMWDEGNQIMKYNPLLFWSLEDCFSFAKNNQVPYNILHDKGFVSIGCEPCTRAIQAGEDFRAGRWWWEDKSKKECGLHG
jgi:phosphoadenosine phosphosulfate reductase